jgi:two-component system, cell cycle sensor histidine kinase and response regulator CckA
MTSKDNRPKDAADPLSGSGRDLRRKAEALARERVGRTSQNIAAREALEESEATIRNKLKAITDPDGDIGTLNLGDIIDSEELQTMMEDFHKTTQIGGAILDISGRVLVGVAWKDICAKFHRVHPDTAKNCLESDLALANGVPAGTFKAYRCKNNMWDMVSPIKIGGKHLGNLYIGQFFYEDEDVDYELFRKQARRHGFDETEYLAALDRVPRLKRETVESAMRFYAKLAGMISSLSYGKIKLSRDIARREQAEEALRESETRFQKMLGVVPDMISIQNPEMDILYSNWQGFAAVPNNRRTLNTKCHKTYRDFDDICPDCLATSVLESRKPIHEETRLPDGKWYDISIIPILDKNNNVEMFMEWVRDITENKQAEAKLIESEARFKHLLSDVPMLAVQGYRFDGATIYWNKGSENLYGYSAEEAIGKNLLDLIIPHDMRDIVKRNIKEMADAGAPNPPEEITMMRKDGTLAPVFSSHLVLRREGRLPELFCFDLDLSDIKESENERRRLQEHLAQAQKMESIGRLAGGVAHDFNNMLGVILGRAEMAMDQVDPAQPLFADLEEIRKAAERSADLTRQLLTFARKQTIAPRIIDLNETVEGMLKMLRRLIGEDIDLTWRPKKNLAPVKMDPAQIDQILANLCVNSRDAISGVGKITIETDVVSFDEAYCADHAGFIPGEFIMLAVSDNGRGMDPETVSHLFEPFFTTKEPGKGTGLGLASVYGAVKQNNGFINVYSEPDQGTTFRIYLPRHRAKTPLQVDKATAKPTAGGNETILLVEDEPAILQLSAMMLERLGYAVIAAETPGEAIRLAHEHGGPIDLLMTDVVMPEMNGRDLAKNLLSIYPDIKRLFMSGYTANVIAHHGVLDEGVYFIQKPFSLKVLGGKLREVLEDQNAG